MDSKTPRLFVPWFDERLRKPDGTAYGKRQRDGIKRKYRLPVIQIGQAEIIIPEQGDARLAKFAGLKPGTPEYLQAMRHEPEPQRRRPGRPRKYAAD